MHWAYSVDRCLRVQFKLEQWDWRGWITVAEQLEAPSAESAVAHCEEGAGIYRVTPYGSLDPPERYHLPPFGPPRRLVP